MTRLLACLLAAGLATPAIAQAPAAPLDRVQRADGARLVPDRFLHRWDPLTVFFDGARGPAAGGVENAPERLLQMAPALDGEWRWLDARTLQFRPTAPWPAGQRVTVTMDGRAHPLTALLPAPVASTPAEGESNLAGLDSLTLSFADPVAPADLARLLRIEHRPSLGDGPAVTLTPADVTVSPLPSADATSRYLLLLRQPLPDGRSVTLRLLQSAEAGLDQAGFTLNFRTPSAFLVQALRCGPGFDGEADAERLRCLPPDAGQARALSLRFSGPLAPPDILAARQALRFTPPVEDLAVNARGELLDIQGRFRADTTYRLEIAAGALRDARGRPLSAPFSGRLAFAAPAATLRWGAGEGMVERLGPQMVPLRGQGFANADLRIHPIDPLARDFWPFPEDGLTSLDAEAPPLAGNEPRPWQGSAALDVEKMRERLRALGTPSVSAMRALPRLSGGAEGRFGLDLAGDFTRINGERQPGTYLVGLRPPGQAERQWLRLQVTDLSLTTVEEEAGIRFTVTSLATARPVEGTEIRLEGLEGDRFTLLARGVTDAAGGFLWQAPAGTPNRQRVARELKRISLVKGADTLVLDPARPPRSFADGRWRAGRSPWLGWMASDPASRRVAAERLCHVFSERPIYRPEEPVHLQGWLRRLDHGALTLERGPAELLVTGPSDQEWRFPVTPDEAGGFHLLFDAKTEATGDYRATLLLPNGEEPQECGSVEFKKEAYRLPTFEVLLDGAERAPLDQPFGIGLTARYFSGGLAADRPITWRVAQFPEAWSPPAREGFVFSTDRRFSGGENFRASPVLTRQARTDAGGNARLELDPTLEPTAQPRRYRIEATVTGDDDIEVRSTRNVVALPAFVLGMKQERYLAQPGRIAPELLVTDAGGQPQPGIAVTARLIRRDWVSVLQASDFSQGAARYVTQQTDTLVTERQVTSTAAPLALDFAADAAGVYLVEFSAEDRLGRRQVLTVDLFMAGQGATTWPRPPAETVTLSTDKPEYAPGETATLLIQSPFQEARALVVTEQPEGRFGYDWVDIQGGVGRAAIPLRRLQMPGIMAHVLLMRGRLPGPPPSPTAPFDQGRPLTLAASQRIAVSPVQHRLQVALQAPASIRPGAEVEVVLRLSDENGRPMAGEAAFWMVDQAVLSLAREAPLDPLPAFIRQRPSLMIAHDTRRLPFGLIPLDENPGGGGAEEEWGQESLSVRRNFSPVPIYLPRVRVGADGVARFRVTMPDSLTVFRMRAKAVSGADRFGFGTGEIRIRQPVIAQPALPRFLRPGDRFEAAVIARLIEGPSGAGSLSVAAPGLEGVPAGDRAFTWNEGRPTRLTLPLVVPGNAAGSVPLRFLLRRQADGAGDAIELTLPIHPDRPPSREQRLLALAPGEAADWPAPSETPRPGSYAARLTASADPAVARILGGFAALRADRWGGTEQRLAGAAATLAWTPFAPLLASAGLEDRLARDTAATLAAIRAATDEDGLVALWPRARGSVWLTAEAFRFLTAAAAAGQPVDAALLERMATVLGRALRSDYPRLLAGEELRERVAALLALAEAGKLEPAYTAELARRATLLPTESLAQVVAAVAALPADSQAQLPGLLTELWRRIRLESRDGRLAYAGLDGAGGSASVLPSETRALAFVTLAVARAAPGDTRLAPLRDGLLRLGGPNGWGTTNADAAALRALAAGWTAASPEIPVAAQLGGEARQGVLNAATPLLSWSTDRPGPARLENRGSAPLLGLAARRYLAAAPGAQAQPALQGFVVSRSLWRVPSGGGPLERLQPGPDGAIRLTAGEVVEARAELVNPEPRNHVALRLPFAAGFEPLNPALATAPAEATPSLQPSLPPDWQRHGDEALTAVWTRLPQGTVQIAVRLRAQVAGRFTEPPGEAEALYQPSLYGASVGAAVEIAP
ncbi:alpha-2-macroglobulin family protein [Roseomonas sp. 18066]|uniref:alpha-2-macroglobulin n=1 Tax=Roseomonas sp. 18066 TaxID=2681412 RepID=UPI00135CA1FC|nr:alpha-2-macroglobulin family protein [Roseomonas sp. 18066]